MTQELPDPEDAPDWATQVPNLPSIHQPPAQTGGSLTPPLTQQQLQATMQFFMTAFVGQIAIAFGGIEIAGWKPLDFIAEWGHDLIEQASAAFQGQQQANQKADLLGGLFGGIDFTSPPPTEDPWQWVVDNILKPLEAWLTPQSPLNAANLWGLLPPGVSLQVPSTSISDTEQNPLWNPDFRGAISFAPGDGWSWDSTVYYVDPDADDAPTPGSAKAIADGTLRALKSNPIPISKGQTLGLSIPVLTSGLVCTGTPIRVDLILFKADSQGTLTKVGTVPVPGMAMGAATGDGSDWVGAPTGAKADVLQGSYEMPDDSTANRAVVRLVVDKEATAGTVWWDHAVPTISGGLIAALKSGFAALQQDSVEAQQAWQEFLQSGWEALNGLITGTKTFAQALADGQAAWNTFAEKIAGIQADGTVTFQKILNALIPGLFPAGSDSPTGLTDLVSSFQERVNAWSTFAQACWTIFTGLINGTLPWTTAAADFQSAWNTFINKVAGIEATGTVTVQKILNSVFPGLFPDESSGPTGLTSLQSGLNDLQEAQQAGAQAFQTLADSWRTTLTDATLSWATKLSQLESAWSTYQQQAQNVASEQIVTLAQIFSGLLGINIENGLTYPSQIDGLSDSWTQLGAALSGDIENAGQWAWLAQIISVGQSSWFSISSDAHSMSVANTNTLNFQNNKPLVYGLDDTTESNIPFPTGLGATSMQLSAGEGGIVTFVRCQQESVKNTVAFVAGKSGSLSQLVVGLYRVDFDNQELIRITSEDVGSQLTTTPKWLFVDADATSVQPGDVLAVMFTVSGTSGSGATFAGQSNLTNATPVHPNAKLPALAASSSSSGSTVPFSDLTFQNVLIPYVGLETSSPPPPSFPDRTEVFTIIGTVTKNYTDDWVTKVDLIGVGGGGGGQGETGAVVGRGGSPGEWNAVTLVRGGTGQFSFPESGLELTITVGDGGAGGPYFSDGSDGQPTKFQWKDASGVTRTLSCAGGNGGGLGNGDNLTTFGQSPGNFSYNDVTYRGGAAMLVPGPGNPPGGSGPGGQPFQFGWAGARGQAWVVERQS
ncbi:hypothetical protein [Mycobacterium shimoidei]|uniref:glycine-rich domain-containing protein n=1 Tax=Mycobacterium shimoidei TaxID=29313 RepID=UPI000DE8FF84|nr:hypothetical protein [Mycobacterium shimoidei]